MNSKLQTLFNEFITSLDEAISNRHLAVRTILFSDGKLIKHDDNKFIYKFEIPESQRISSEDSIEIFINGESHGGEVLSVDNQFVTFLLPHNLGKSLKEISVQVQPSKVNEKTRELLSKIANSNNNFSAAEKLFVSEKLSSTNIPKLKISSQFNSRQKEAIKKSLQNDITLIWGPPGTGKTKTLGAIAYNLIASGYKVLFASNTNRAVDNGILSILEYTKKYDSDLLDYIIRYGPISLFGYEDLDNSEFSRKVEIIKQRNQEKISKLQKLLNAYYQLSNDIESINTQKSERDSIKNNLISIQNEFEINIVKIKKLKEKLDKLNNSSSIANSFRSIFSGHTVQTISEEINSLKSISKSQREQIKEIESSFLVKQKFIDENQKTIEQYELIKKKIDSNGGVTKIKVSIDSLEKQAEDEIFKNMKLLGSTVAKIIMNKILHERIYDVLLIDEASMISLPFLAVLSAITKTKIIIIGDPQQLAPITHTSNQYLNKDIYSFLSGTESSSEMLDWQDENKHFTVFLDTQYRMAANLSKVISELFYNNRLKNSDKNNSVSGDIVLINTKEFSARTFKMLDKPRPYTPFNVIHTQKIIDQIKWAFTNLKIPSSLDDNILVPITAKDIGIICPFNTAAQFVRQKLKETNLRNIEVGTIPTFQGREKALIIFDTVLAGINYSVRSFDTTKTNIADVSRNLNVALSRAKYNIIVLADLTYFEHFYRGQLINEVLNRLISFSIEVDTSNAAEDFNKLSQEEIDELLGDDDFFNDEKPDE